MWSGTVVAMTSPFWNIVRFSFLAEWHIGLFGGGVHLHKQESGYRWLVLASVAVVYLLVVSQRTAPGLISNRLMVDFHISAAVVGVLVSVQFLAYAAFQIPMGLLSDRYGPNYFLLFGAFLDGIGTVIYSLAPNEYVLIFARFLVGTGDASIFINFVLILNTWFKENEFVKLLGLVGLASGFGSLLATVPFSKWISVAGWRPPFFTVGMILMVFSLFLYVILIGKPRQIFGDESSIKKKTVKIRESVWMTLRHILTTRQAWATFMCHFGVVGTYIGFIGSWGVAYGMDVLYLSRSEASQLIMYGLFGAMVGSPLMSWLASRLGAIKRVYISVQILVLMSWLGLFLLGIKPSFILVVILLFLIGFGNGASALTFAVVRQSFPLMQVGVASGFANMGGFLSAVLLPIVFGGVLQMFPQHALTLAYHDGFIVPILFSAIGVLGALLIKEVKIEQREVLGT